MNIIPQRASDIFFKPKNIELHKKFNNNCIIKKARATNFLEILFAEINTKNEAKIIRYKIIQTGAKIQSGGVPIGKLSEWYQSKFIISFILIDKI